MIDLSNDPKVKEILKKLTEDEQKKEEELISKDNDPEDGFLIIFSEGE